MTLKNMTSPALRHSAPTCRRPGWVPRPARAWALEAGRSGGGRWMSAGSSSGCRPRGFRRPRRCPPRAVRQCPPAVCMPRANSNARLFIRPCSAKARIFQHERGTLFPRYMRSPYWRTGPPHMLTFGSSPTLRMPVRSAFRGTAAIMGHRYRRRPMRGSASKKSFRRQATAVQPLRMTAAATTAPRKSCAHPDPLPVHKTVGQAGERVSASPAAPQHRAPLSTAAA